MPGLKPSGLIDSRSYGEGKHLFHSTDAPVVVHTPAEEEAARQKGYGDSYIVQEYPKQIGEVVVHNAEQEAALTPKPPKHKRGE